MAKIRILVLGILLATLGFVPALGAQSFDSDFEEIHVIRARAFILEDDQGRTRGGLRITDEQPGLFLVDENGKECVSLFMLREGPMLLLQDRRNDKPRIGLSVLKNIPSIVIFDENGVPCVWLSMTENNPELILLKNNIGVSVMVNETGSALTMYDKNGKKIWQAP